MVIFNVTECELGYILVARSEQGVCAIAMDDSHEALLRWCTLIYPHALLDEEDQQLTEYLCKVQDYIKKPSNTLDIPLDIHGTPFQKRVWQAIQSIPAGQQCSYTKLADMIGRSSATRAVASACAANLLALAIPCHRIVRKDGGFSGYRWGCKRKQWLLEKEQKN